MQQNKNKVIAIVLMLLIQFVVTFEMDVVFPLTPHIALVYGIASYQVAYMNIGNAIFGMFAPLIGFASDKTGLKKMIGFTLVLFIIGTLIIGLIPSMVAYVVGRSLTGLAFFTMLGLSLNYLSMLVSEDKLGVVSGLHRIAFAFGVMISPFIGTYLVEYMDFQAIYLGLALTTLVLLVLYMVLSPEVQVDQEAIVFDDALALIKGKRERRMILITFLLSTPAIFFFNYLSVHLDFHGMSAQMIASVYTLVAIGSIFGGISIMLFADKMGKFKMITLVTTLIPFVLLMFYFSKGSLLFIVGIMFGFLFDSATGLLIPVGSLVVKQYKATFLTILTLTMSFVNVLSNIIAPSLYNVGGFLLLVIIMSLSIFSASVLLRSLEA